MKHYQSTQIEMLCEISVKKLNDLCHILSCLLLSEMFSDRNKSTFFKKNFKILHFKTLISSLGISELLQTPKSVIGSALELQAIIERLKLLERGYE